MSDSIRKSYDSIYELPSEVRASFDENDQKKWMDIYNRSIGSGTSENAIKDAKFNAWKSMVDAPSSLAVETWASVEVRDADGELVPVKTIAENMDRFIQNKGTMHDSHTNVVIGSAWGWEQRKHPETGQDGIVLYFNVNRDGEVAERARDDILSGRKQAVSIGAEAPRGGYKCDDRGCYVERDVTDLYEISICETPANPEAYFINVGKDIAKSKYDGEVFRLHIKDVNVHQDYTTCPLQKCKKDVRDRGFMDVHIVDDMIVAKSKYEAKLYDALMDSGYVTRYNLKKQQFEIFPDYTTEQAIEEALSNQWACEDMIGHIALTRQIPENVFKDWYDRGFIVKIGDTYCLDSDDLAKSYDSGRYIVRGPDGVGVAMYLGNLQFKQYDENTIRQGISELVDELFKHRGEYDSKAVMEYIDYLGLRDLYEEQKDDVFNGTRSPFNFIDENKDYIVDTESNYLMSNQFTDYVGTMYPADEYGNPERYIAWLYTPLYSIRYMRVIDDVMTKDGGAMGVSTAGATNAVYGGRIESNIITGTKTHLTDDDGKSIGKN